MPLNKQLAALPLRAGVDTKSQKAAIVPGKMSRLENAVFTKTGSLHKCNGYAALGQSIGAAGGSTEELEDGQALMGFRGEVLAADPTTLYSYDGGSEQWIEKGTLVSCHVTQAAVSAPAAAQTFQDGATHSGGLQAYAWTEASAIRYSVIDSVTGQIVVPSTVLATTGTRSRVLVLGNRFVFLYYDTTATRIYVASLSVGEPLATMTPVAVTSVAVDENSVDPGSSAYDATIINSASVGQQLFLVFNNDTAAGGLSIWRFAPGDLVNPEAKATAPGETATTLTLFPNAYDDTVILAYYNSAAVQWRTYTAALVTPTSITISAANDAFSIYVEANGTTGTLTGNLTAGTYTQGALVAELRTKILAALFDGDPFSVVGTCTVTVSAVGYVTIVLGGLDATAGPLDVTRFEWATSAATQALGTILGMGTATLTVPNVGVDGSATATSTGASRMPSIVSGTPNLTAFGIVETLSGVNAITGVCCSSTALDVRFFYSTSSRVTRTATISGYTYRVSALGLILGVPWCEVTGAPSTLRRSVLLAGKAFARSGQAYLLVATTSSLQPTFFLVDGAGVILARLYPGTAAVTITGGDIGFTLPAAASVTSSSWRYALRSLAEVISGTGLGSVTAGTFDLFEPEQSYARAELGGNLNIGGGIVWTYDGGQVVEQNFLMYPENNSSDGGLFDAESISGRPSGNFNYQYVAVYAWTDAQGNIHRSSTSVPKTYSQNAAISTGVDRVTVTMPTLRMTNRSAASVRIELYRTVDDGSLFYRLTTASATSTSNDATVDVVTYTDSTTDASLIAGLPLYTTGNVLDNTAPPPSSALCVHGRRLFALDTTSGQIAVSKITTTGEPVEFAAELAIPVEDATALGSLDDKLVIFGRSSASYISGDGPDDTGAGSWPPPTAIATDVGCINPRGVVATPAGLIFPSTKGFRLLGRDLSVSYIGADVEAYNGDTVTSAVLLKDADQVRFTLDSGVALFFDYGNVVAGREQAGQWSVRTNLNATDSIIWNDRHTYIRPSGAVLEETPGVYTDAGSHIRMRVTTSWLQFAGFSGFQRVYRAFVLGDYASAHKLRVSVAYDLNENVTQVAEIEPEDASTWGSDATWGSGAYWGGTFPTYAWRIDLDQQKCSAVQLTIEDAQDGAPGESMSLTALTFLVGVKPGGRKLPAAAIAS